jgi:hypothetical protein
MRVTVQKPYGIFSVGHVIPDMPANQARIMIARGLVAECDGDHDSESKAMRSPADRMLRSSNATIKRGKPRRGVC